MQVASQYRTEAAALAPPALVAFRVAVVQAAVADAEERAAVALDPERRSPRERAAWKAEGRAIAADVFAGCKPPKFRGPLRAAHIGQLIRTAPGDWPLEWTLRDLVDANRVAFEPPYDDAELERIVRHVYRHLGVNVDG